ncbi:hypothetical protein ATY81_05885 [Rhizobium sp. R72]|uniref:hypothetical protein n=1 Tax=unclassified Rhizobium TaxID=2613769 RepID=UPI000B53796A|nr:MULTISPECIES: hypothetical protein [unclassified Rhizobium]OWV90858.1 hypothetical protein ATY79_05500 [Rhizobium sp. R693]OWW00779.1 hypothetical protein ATY81_05885 [Rhizobium sp. R72]OWW01158.1 hypothetical protein ATY80_05885 [Rhizobium sp. R711]
MEILSVRSSPNFLFRRNSDNSSNYNELEAQFGTATKASTAFHIDETNGDTPDFSAISASELRQYARQSFDAGAIDQDTFAAISEPLPMRTVDPSGNILDLSDIADATSFNFRDYYKGQLQIATSIGDPQTVARLDSVVSFLNV